MSEPYEEIVEGETLLRFPPGIRHEQICHRLHARLAAILADVPSTRLLVPRSMIQLSAGTMLRPDLSLVAAATGKLWLAVEVVDSEDHRPDTVTKKTIYEDLRIPRLWMVDPRYDNVEIYRSTEYGLALKQILAGRDLLRDDQLPAFQMTIAEVFSG